jgi:hypothetical protein
LALDDVSKYGGKIIEKGTEDSIMEALYTIAHNA